MKRTIEEIGKGVEFKSLSGIIKISRPLAQAKCKASIVQTHDSEGNVIRQKNLITVNDEKIADTCMQLFQESNSCKKIIYKEIREEAEKIINKDFEMIGLVTKKTNTKKENNEIEKKRELAIAKYIKTKIINNFNTTFKVDFKKFIQLTNIKSLNKFNNAFNMLLELQQKSFFEWEEETISDDYLTLQKKLTSVSLIPSISLVLNSEKLKEFNLKTIDDFKKSKIQKKEDFIEYIQIEISKEYISSTIGLGRDFTLSNRKIRNNFKKAYTFKLDWLIRSITNAKYNKNVNYFLIQELQDTFGTNYTQTNSFVREVLTPAIKELNQYSELTVSLIPHKEGKTIIAYSFKIEKDESKIAFFKAGINKTAYYIASRLYYFRKDENIESLIGFANYIENELKEGNNKEMNFAEKTLLEWEEEAKNAYDCESKLLKLMESKKQIVDMKNLEYDKNQMCLIEHNIETKLIDKIYLKQNKVNYIKYNDKIIDNPILSLEFFKRIDNDNIIQ